VKHVSLCSGIGGLELALGTPDAFFEIDAAPAQVLAAQFPSVPNYGDWTQLDQFDDDVALVSGGLPCQPLSGAGKGKGDADERYLFDELVRILRASDVRPQLVLENVRGILYPRNAQAFWRFISALADLGYVGQWEIVRASDAGAPHKRERWFCVARHADGEGLEGHRPERRLGETRKEEEAGGTGSASRHADGVAGEATLPLGPDGPEELRSRIGQGVGSGHSEVAAYALGGQGPKRHFGQVESKLETSRWGDVERRGLSALWESKYGPAVRRWETLTRPAPSPLDERSRLNVSFVEWMMGFPEGWTEPLGRSKALKALGNAVVPQQAALALEILGVTEPQAAAA